VFVLQEPEGLDDANGGGGGDLTADAAVAGGRGGAAVGREETESEDDEDMDAFWKHTTAVSPGCQSCQSPVSIFLV